MLILKLTILAWIFLFFIRFFITATMTNEEKFILKLTGKLKKMTLFRWVMVLDFLLAVVGTIVSAVWLLFFR